MDRTTQALAAHASQMMMSSGVESDDEFDGDDPFVPGDEVTQQEREMENALDLDREIERREVILDPLLPTWPMHPPLMRYR